MVYCKKLFAVKPDTPCKCECVSGLCAPGYWDEMRSLRCLPEAWRRHKDS